MKLFKLLFSLIVILLLSFDLSAQIPRIINYQGLLLGSDEQPVAEGDYKITFSIYDEGNSLLWSEVHPKVFVVDGFFHVLLGTATPLNIPFDETYLVGVKVNDDAEMQPRMLLTSSAYSLNSERVGGYEVSQNPEPNKLLPLNSSGKIPDSALPSGSPVGNYLAKNTADSTKGSSSTEMLRVENEGTGRGMTVVSKDSHGIYAKSSSNYAGLEGEGAVTGPGVRGTSLNNHGVIGYSAKSDKGGVYGNNTDGIGVYGNSQNNHGVYGQSNTGRGVKGVSAAGGVYGESTQGVAVEGRSNANDGVVGWSNDPNKSGVFGNSPFGNGVTGRSEKKDGILGVTTSSDAGHAGVHARNEGTGPAVYSEGDTYTTGKVYGDVGPSQGAPFPRPAYNSGWIEVTPPTSFDLGVDQYLPTTQYSNSNFFIEQTTKWAGWILANDKSDCSYSVNNDNSMSVSVFDEDVTHVRIRIWYIK